MYIARLICTDPGCAERVTVEGTTLRELEMLACECGCGLELIGWPDHVDDEVRANVLQFRPRARRGGDMPEAA